MQSFGYELLYIIPAIASRDEVALVIANVVELLKKEDANILRHELWSERRLAYSIKQSDTGKYVLCYFKVSSDAIFRIRQSLRLFTSIARHCIIRHEKIEETMDNFFAYQEALKEKRRSAVSRPKERRYEQTRFPEQATQIAHQPFLETQSAIEKPIEIKPEIVLEPLEVEAPKKEREPEAEAVAHKEQPVVEIAKKKRSLAELDQKLDKLLEGDIEL